MKNLYLVLAIVGAVVPLAFFYQFFGDPGQPGFVAALFVNGAAGGFAADLLLSSVVFWLVMWARRGHGPSPWAFVALNLFIGLSCALPAYWYFDCRRAESKSGQ